MILCIVLSKVNLKNLIANFSNINVSLILFTILLNLPLICIKACRWKQILAIQSIQYNLKDSFIVYLVGIYVGVVTPGRLGEFVKVLYLKSDKQISLSKGMSSVLVDRLFDLYLLIILGLISIWKFDILGIFSNTVTLLLVIIISAPLCILNKKLMTTIVGLIYKYVIKIKVQFEEKFDDFYKGINQLINLKLIFTAILTCLGYLVFFTQCYLIAIAMGISINFITITLFMAISNLISFIPISISGLGTRDATLIYLFSLIDLSPELAISYAFLVFFTFFVCGGLMGGIAWFLKPLPIKE